MSLLETLLEELKGVCRTFPDAREGRSGNIGIEDFGLSAFSMFFMQSESFLSYQRALETGQKRSNCQTLFGTGKIPSGNYIRSMLDEADPALLQPCFDRLAAQLAKPDAISLSTSRRPHADRVGWNGVFQLIQSLSSRRRG